MEFEKKLSSGIDIGKLFHSKRHPRLLERLIATWCMLLKKRAIIVPSLLISGNEIKSVFLWGEDLSVPAFMLYLNEGKPHRSGLIHRSGNIPSKKNIQYCVT